MRVLCVTHSSRPFFDARSRLNSINQRFEPERLSKLPAFESLPAHDTAIPFDGGLSIWEIVEDTWTMIGGFQKTRPTSLNLLKVLEPGYKVQYACFVGDSLVLLGSDRIELYDPQFKLKKTIRDGWLVGGHTLSPVPDTNTVWVTSAPSNSVLEVNLDSGEVTRRIPMPDRYGVGYKLTAESDLHQHFIPTDSQPCHVNSCEWSERGLLVTLWIQGAVGLIAPDGDFTEIVSGFRGCHGAKWHCDDQIVFADSATGVIVFLDAAGHIVRRLDTGSRWLHDVQPIGKGILAATIGDQNQLRLIDEARGITLWSQNLDEIGASTMFVKEAPVPRSWEPVLAALGGRKQERPSQGQATGSDFLETLFSQGGFRSVIDSVLVMPRAKTATEVTTEVILKSNELVYLRPGMYELHGVITCKAGSVTIGLIDTASGSWVGQIRFDEVQSETSCLIEVKSAMKGYLTLAAANDIPARVEFEMVSCTLHSVEPAKKNLIPPFNDRSVWAYERAPTTHEIPVYSRGMALSEYLLATKGFTLPPGRFRFSAWIDCEAGSVSSGIVVLNGGWICQCRLSEDLSVSHQEFSLDEETPVQFVVAANNVMTAPVRAFIREVYLEKMDQE